VKKLIDLHVHAKKSDGTFTPVQIVELAERAGLAAVAITDHETCLGVTEAVKAAENTSVRVIPGIELSTKCYVSDEFSASIHIVGLFIDVNNEKLLRRTEEYRNHRISKAKKMIASLQDDGIDIAYEVLEREYQTSMMTRAHIADYLLQKGYIKDADEAFTAQYIGDDSKAYCKTNYMDAKEALQLITGAGGIAVFAHPLIYGFNEYQLQGIIDVLKPYGLMAVEAEYSKFTQQEREYVRELAYRNGLLLSGGSDFHGDILPGIDIGKGRGDLEVPYEYLEKMLRYREK
jgi:predicted metal-dependent phosphoesterase TrpH